jgi:signal transduction histidine kinase
MQNPAIELFYLFFQGVLTFQVLVFGVLYFITRRKDLLYYSLFLFSAAAYFFINAPYTFFGIPEETVWNSRWYDYVNTPVIIVEDLFYLLFITAFFEDISFDKTVGLVFRFTLLSVPFIAFLFVLLSLLHLNKQFIFYSVNMLTVVPATVLAYVVLKRKLPFYSLVANGLVCTITGTCVTVMMIVLRNFHVHHLFTDGYPLFFIRLGLLGDMIFYLAAILKKWHFQEKQLAIEKVRAELGLEQVRNRIAGELHDDFGSTLSGISMYSYLTSGFLQSGEYDKAKESLGVIQRSARDMVLNLSDLVWTINPKQDSLEILLERLQQYGTEICAAKQIAFRILFKQELLSNALTMETRHEIYLFVKEAINNAVKHSGARVVEFSVEELEGLLCFSVTDDGDGFDSKLVKKGNGLKNMQERANLIGAMLVMQSGENMGTSISLQCKIT